MLLKSAVLVTLQAVQVNDTGPTANRWLGSRIDSVAMSAGPGKR